MTEQGPQPGDTLYLLVGETAFAKNMNDFQIETFEYSRETAKRWWVKFRGGEKWFDKSNSNVFFAEILLKKRLQAIRERKLLTARRNVTSLENQKSIPVRAIPAGTKTGPQEPFVL